MTANHLHLLWVWCVAATALGCSQKTLPAYGEVLVLLSTDMQVPDSFDTVILTVNGKGHAFSAANTTAPLCSVGDGSSTTLSDAELKLPTTIALTSEKEQAITVAARLTACKGDEVVFERGFEVELPEAGQLKMLRAPIRWLCNDRSKACYGCGSSGTDGSLPATAPCYHQNISLITAPGANPCEIGTCHEESGIFEAVTYVEREARLFDPASTTCFEPWSCFDMKEDSQFDAHKWVQVPAGWRQADADAGTEKPCAATIDAAQFDLSNPTLNLALVLPPGSGGFCDKSRCFVPLDEASAIGWQRLDRAPGQVSLPAAVCHMLDSGQILYVVAAANSECGRKNRENPVCGKPTRPVLPNSIPRLVDFASITAIHLPLDDASDQSSAVFSDSENVERLQRVSLVDLQALDVSSDIAVMRRAGRFNSLSFAQGPNTEELRDARTFAAWVSLTESPPAEAAVMPVLSNVSKDCSSGVRLDLRTCANDPAVYVALGVPSGSGDSDQCSFDYRFARLTATSYRGGYFSPWKIGTFFHVAATLPSANGARIYVDGKQAELAEPPCGHAAAGEESSDGDSLYLGSNVARSKVATASHEILLDEVTLFEEALEANDIRRLMVELSTQSGASGLRWGVWATQGGGARIDTATPLPRFTIDDRTASSAGAFATLETTDLLISKSGSLAASSLALGEFDEAVLIVSHLPEGMPFQFAFASEHGERQCTWQLNAAAGTQTDTVGDDTYVINLRKPSWCVDPACSFDTSNVARVSIGSGWFEQQSEFQYTVKALAFRTHPPLLAETTSRYLGGVTGPSGWCWKSVVYDSAWEVWRAKNASLEPPYPVVVAAPTLYDMPNDLELPELAADLLGDLGSRDLTACQKVNLDIEFGPRNTKIKSTDDRKLVLTNELGQSCTFDISDPSNQADLTGNVTYWTPVASKATCADVRKAVTRISVRYSGSVQVNGVSCCRADGGCVDIASLPLTESSN